MPPKRTQRIISSLCIGSLMLCACSSPHNDRMTLGGSYLSPTLRPPADHTETPESQAPNLLIAPLKPRSQWEPIQYIAPFDGVVHSPRLIISKPLEKTDPPRVYGRFPSSKDVLDAQSESWINNLLISIDDLGRTLIGTPYIAGLRLIGFSLDQPSLSPQAPYKRSQESDWSSGFPQEPDQSPTTPNGSETDDQTQ